MIVEKAPKLPLMGLLAAGAVVGLLTSLLGLVSPWGGALLLLLPGALLAAWAAYSHPRWIVYFLLVFMPFENLILKFIPGPDMFYTVASFVSEILIYLTLGLVLVRRMWSGEPLRKTPIDIFFILFLIVALLSILVNESPLFGSLVNIRVLIRYIFLFYLVSNLDFSPAQVSGMVRLIIVLGIIEVLIGALQFVVGEPLNQFLLPRQSEFNIAGIGRGFVLVNQGREIGAIFGTLGDTLFFALFMLIVLAAYLSTIERLLAVHFIFWGVIFLAVNFAYARAVAFAILVMLLWFYNVRYGLSKLLVRLFPLITLSLLLLLSNVIGQKTNYIHPDKEEVSIVENLMGVFTKEYIRLAQNSRLGAVLDIPPTVLANRPILGYGPDETATIERLNASSPSYLHKTLKSSGGFEDVYWAAMLAYYGIIGVILWILMFHALYRFARRVYENSSEKVARGIAITMICLVIVSIALLFFYRILEFRIFSFYFWLLAGLLVSLYFRERKQFATSQARH